MSFDLSAATAEVILAIAALALLLLGTFRGEQDGAQIISPLAALTMLVAA